MITADSSMTTATPDLQPILAVVRERLGLRTDGPAAARVRAGVLRLMDAVGVTDGETLAALLERDPRAFDRLVDEVTVPETFFSRERDQLIELRRRVLPELRSGRGPAHVLRVWSAGCSTGEEAYSLALILDGVAGGRPSRILATDVSTTALETARTATYRRSSLRRADDATRRLLEPAEGGSLRVPPRIAEQVEFDRLNLVTDPYPPTVFDLIVCRNVLVYLTETARRHVAARLAASLAHGGWLLIASTDPRAGLDEHLEAVRTPAGTLYRRPAIDARPSIVSDTPSGRGSSGRVADLPPVDGDAVARPTRLERTDARDDRRSDAGPGTGPAERVRELTAAGRLDDALAAVRDAIAEEPFDADLRCLEGIVLLEAGDPEGAAAAARAATYVAPDGPSGYLVLGRAILALGDRTSALRAFSTARELLAALPQDTEVSVFERPAGELLRTATTLVATTAGAGR